MKEKIDFDDFVDDYERLVGDQTGFFASNPDYFARRKAEICHSLVDKLQVTGRRYLDFGCGIGLGLNAAIEVLGEFEHFGYEPSERSLDVAKRHHSNVTFLAPPDLGSYDGNFDLILAAGVFHHVEPENRYEALSQIRNLLSDDGVLVVFEHNPYNPVTQKIVSNCIFDEDAELIRASDWDGLLAKPGLIKRRSAYTLFFPEWLKAFSLLEPMIGWLPLGGQYYVVASKKEDSH